MESQTLILLSSSMLFISIIIAVVVVYFVVIEPKTKTTTTPEEETTPQEETLLEETLPEEEVIQKVQPTPATIITKKTLASPTPKVTIPPTPPTPKPTTAAPYEIGQAIMCTSNDVGGGLDAIYRYDGNNTLRMYPDAETARSWDPDFLNAKKINCADLEMGSNMSRGSGQKTAPGEPTPTPDPDYAKIPTVVDKNYRNIPDSCYTEAGGLCNELKYEDCYAVMKNNGDFVIRKDADTIPTMVWNTSTQYVGADAKFILGNDGRFHVMANDINFWGSSNSDSTNGPFVAHLEKDKTGCHLSIYDKDNTKIYTTE